MTIYYNDLFILVKEIHTGILFIPLFEFQYNKQMKLLLYYLILRL